MADERYTFTQAKTRLEDIVVQVRKKDVSLEHSLDLLEEGVRLASSCTELIDHTEWRAVAEELQAESKESAEPDAETQAEGASASDATDAVAEHDAQSSSEELDDEAVTPE